MLTLQNYQLIFNSHIENGLHDLYTHAANHGIPALVWDAVREARVEIGQNMPKALKLQWALNVSQIETRYARQRVVIGNLAKFFSEHGIKMLVLKGYGLSLNYPTPKHRPCGDVDIVIRQSLRNMQRAY